MERDKESSKLLHYKNISYKEGYDYFLSQMKDKYPETNLDQKLFVVYRWDSTIYDFIHKDQMRALDSMAAGYGKYKIEYIFATEMEQAASESFLKRNHDEYKNVKMLYGMDDFISGFYSLKNLKFMKPKILGHRIKDTLNFKQSNFYVIMDPKGKVLHFNGRMCMILKDSAFLNKLRSSLPAKDLKILN